MATKKASSLLRHQEGGKSFEIRVSIETPAPRPIDLYQNKNLDDIDTHKLALQKVIEAIEDENIQIIGIYGLLGAGKTTLAMEGASKMKKQFAAVAIINVSQTVNAKKIKEDIVNETKQIMQGKKILIILDDVWEKLDLEQLGILCGTNHMNCKILLTSRNVDVCKKMNAQSKICVDPLPSKESWILFKRVVGEEVEADDNLKQVAMKVAEECGGLPLLVQAVGYALKDKSIDSWNSALTQLQKHAPSDIDPDIKQAFIHLKLSYDYLESEDVTILLEDLVYYGVGLEKFNEIEIMYDARDRVRNAVDILTSSSLLLNTNNKESTRMHDVVRDVALLIASKGNNKFLVRAGRNLTEWLPRNNTYEGYTRISLMDNYIDKLPDYDLHFPRLDTFLIQFNELSTISNEFVGAMKEVRVLDMERNKISSLPESFRLLTKLRMLNLRGNKSLQEISILGELKDLEILILRETGIKEIPWKLGQLLNLRVFDVRRCKDLRYITPGVISRLLWLEELGIELSSIRRGIYDIMVEVTSLSKLTYLDLFVPCFDVILEGFSCWKMKSFKIQIGKFEDIVFHSPISESYIIIYLDSVEFPLLKR